MPAQDNKQSIADILLKNKAITSEQYQRIRLESLNTGKLIEDIVTTHNFATPDEITKARSEYYEIPLIDLKEISVSPEAINLLPEQAARKYHCFPYGLDRDKDVLLLAMENPLDLNAIEFIELKTKKRISASYAMLSQINDLISKYYAQSLSTEVTEALKESGKDSYGVKVVNAEQMGKIIREAPLAKIVATLLDFAIEARASDIHIETQEDKTRIRYRIDGILHEKLVLPRNIHDGVISRIKILSGMKIDEKRIPQDGRFTFQNKDQEVDLRVSSLPTVHGEKIVMRLLKKTGNVPTMTELGLRGKALKDVEKAIILPHGIVLITGPTGSGKTTTLYSILSKINTARVNIMTLEDPVEYEIIGVSQVQVNPKAGLTFASGLRSFLRQDPDIIMVGEIRDKETAELAIQAALTGHLVFSTLHTNSSSGALPRLLDMEVEPYLLASSVLAIIGQRVVRKICNHCKQSYVPPQELVEDIKKVLGPLYNVKGQLKLYKGKGCEKCGDTGYVGRIGIFEVLPVEEKIARLILERSPSSKLETQARESGMVTMTQDGYLKTIEGVTTIEEVLRVSEV